LASALTALVTKTRSPQTIGLECASPGIGVRQRTCSPVLGFQVSGSRIPSAIPAACAPRNDGQLPAGGAEGVAGGFAMAWTVMRRGGIAAVSVAGRHVLRSRIIRRGRQSSAMTANVTSPPGVASAR
jgi:hypothetical protein